MNRTIRVFLLMSAAVTMLMAASASAQVFQIAPGRLSSFDISFPANARAGEPVTLTIIAKDAAGNVVTNYDRVGGGVTLAAVMGAERLSAVEPNRFPASAFRDGKLSAQVTIIKSGTMEIEISDPVLRVSTKTSRIDARPGAVSMIKVGVPNEARVGEPFDLSIELYDAYGNAVVDFDRYGGEVILKSGARGAVGVVEPARISSTSFDKGRASVKVRYTQAERVSIACEVPPARGVSREFDVRAGALHTFEVTLPSKPVLAGEAFGIMIEAKDQGGNTIADYARVGAVVELKTTGSGMIEPSTIPPTAFNAGIAMVTVRYNTAERIGIIAQDAGGSKRGESREKIEVAGGRLARLEIIPAERARAGEPLVVQVMGYDIYGNLIKEYGGRNLRAMLSTADAAPIEAPIIQSTSFRDGIAFVSATPTRAGSVVLQAVDEVTGAGGRSAPIDVKPGAVSAYTLKVPTIAIAHEPFEVEITAFDRFGNIVTDYARTGNGLVVKKSGLGDISPATISPSSFDEGVAKVKFTCNSAEEVVIAVNEQGGVAEGKSPNMLVTHANPSRFEIAAGTQATAGEPVKLKISVLDAFGNPVVGYGMLSRSVSLFTENGEPLTPQMISSGMFRNGVAELDAIFLRTGEAVIVAEEAGGRVIGKSAVVRVLPSRPAQIFIAAPSSAEAGVPLNLRIEMRDKLANRIRDYSPQATSLSVKVLDPNGGRVDAGVELGNVMQMRFREGIAEISVLPKKTGTILFEISDEMLQVGGRSPRIEVGAGPVDHFKVESLSQGGLLAGEAMKLRITALDAFENPVKSFGADGSGARMLARVKSGTNMIPATGVFQPSTLRGETFRDGQADIYAVYDRAEAVEIGIDRVAPGTLSRPEVVTVVSNENAGGTMLSVILNGVAARSEVRRVTESIFELMLPGAILSSGGTRMTKSSGIVSLVAMNQSEDGVRILVHTSSPAAVRSAEDANRIILSVEPVIAFAPQPAPIVVAPSVLPNIPAVIGSGASVQRPVSAAMPTLQDVDRLVRENRFGEALQLVNIMLGANPGDAALINLKRRLELLAPYQRNIAPQAQPIQQNYAIPALQNAPIPVQTGVAPSQPSIAAAENEIRSGRYAEALRILDSYLASKPGDETALRMKQRVEQLMRLLGR